MNRFSRFMSGLCRGGAVAMQIAAAAWLFLGVYLTPRSWQAAGIGALLALLCWGVARLLLWGEALWREEGLS